MKYSYVALVAAGLVAAQSPTDYFPDCALPCLQEAISGSTDCAVTEYACQCEEANQSAIQSAATTCVIEACTAEVALNEVLPAAAEFCAAINAGGSDGGDSGDSEPSPTEAPEETEAPVETETPEETEAPEETPMETSTPTMTGNGTIHTGPVEVSGASGPAVGIFAAILAAFAAL